MFNNNNIKKSEHIKMRELRKIDYTIKRSLINISFYIVSPETFNIGTKTPVYIYKYSNSTSNINFSSIKQSIYSDYITIS